MADKSIINAIVFGGKGSGGGGGTSNYESLSNLPQINGHTLTGNKTAEDLGLSGDDVPTEDSDNPVKSGGVYDGIVANTQLMSNTVGWSGKNKAKSYYAESYTEQYYRALNIEFDIQPNTKYIISFDAPVGNTYYINESLFSASEAVTTDGNRKSVTVTTKSTIDSSQHNATGWFVFKNSIAQSSAPSFSDVMITDADVLDQSYEPYFGSTAFPRSEQAVLGAKNLLPNLLTSGTDSAGVTYTKNSDGSISMSASTISANTDRAVYDTRDTGVANFLKGQSLVLYKGLEDTNVKMLINAYQDNSYVKTIVDLENGIVSQPFILDYVGYNRTRIIVYVKSTANLTTPKTIYPMIRLASDPDSAYQPYAMTNRELTDAVSNISNGYVKIGRLVLVNKEITLTAALVQGWNENHADFTRLPNPVAYVPFRGHIAGGSFEDFLMNINDSNNIFASAAHEVGTKIRLSFAYLANA